MAIAVFDTVASPRWVSVSMSIDHGWICTVRVSERGRRVVLRGQAISAQSRSKSACSPSILSLGER